MARKNQQKHASKPAPRPAVPASAFLPTTRAEADARGWDTVEFVYVAGDADVVTPAFTQQATKYSEDTHRQHQTQPVPAHAVGK